MIYSQQLDTETFVFDVFPSGAVFSLWHPDTDDPRTCPAGEKKTIVHKNVEDKCWQKSDNSKNFPPSPGRRALCFRERNI